MAHPKMKYYQYFFLLVSITFVSCSTTSYDITDSRSFKVTKIDLIKHRFKHKSRGDNKKCYIIHAERYNEKCLIYSIEDVRVSEKSNIKYKGRVKKNGVYLIDVKLYNNPNVRMHVERGGSLLVNDDDTSHPYGENVEEAGGASGGCQGLKVTEFWPFDYHRYKPGTYHNTYFATNLNGLDLMDFDSKLWRYHTEMDGVTITLDESGEYDKISINDADFIVTDKHHGYFGNLRLFFMNNSDTVYYSAKDVKSVHPMKYNLVELTDEQLKREFSRLYKGSRHISCAGRYMLDFGCGLDNGSSLMSLKWQ